MGIKKEDLKNIRKELTNSKRPVILFDDDPDGISSFLMVYKFVGEGRGIPVKNSPNITVDYAKKVNDYSPDLVIILDKALVSQDFINKIKAKIIWIDHHPIVERKGMNYYNPSNQDNLLRITINQSITQLTAKTKLTVIREQQKFIVTNLNTLQ